MANINQDVNGSDLITIGVINGNPIIVQTHQLDHRNEPKHIGIKTIERVSKDALNWFLQHSHWALQQAYPMSSYDYWEFESVSEVETGLYNAIFLMTFSLQNIPFGTYQWRIRVIIDESGDVINVEDVKNTCPLKPGQQSQLIEQGFQEIGEFIGRIFGE